MNESYKEISKQPAEILKRKMVEAGEKKPDYYGLKYSGMSYLTLFKGGCRS